MEWIGPLTIQFILGLWLVALLITGVQRWRHPLSWKRDTCAWLGGILLLTGLFRGAAVPFQHRVYYDEDVYVQIARGISVDGRARQATAAIISDGRYRCESGTYPKWPSGWPTLLSTLFRVFGPSESIVFVTNFGISLLSVALVGLLAGQLLPGNYGWLSAAAVYAVLPANAAWGSTAAADPAAAALNTGTVLAFAYLARHPLSRGALLLAVTTAALAAQFRAESILILLPAPLILLSTLDHDATRTGGATPGRRYCWGALLLMILLLPHAVHLGLVGTEYDPAMGEGIGFGLDHILPNLLRNAAYFVEEPLMTIVTVLAVVGGLRYRRRRVSWVLTTWFLLFFAVFLPYFVGSYRLPGLERYALMSLAPYAILAATGIDAVVQWTTKRASVLSEAVLAPCLALGFVVAGAFATPGHLERWDAPTQVLSEEHQFLRRVTEQLPQNAVVMFPVPSLFINLGRSSVWPYPDVDTTMLEELIDHAEGELYLYAGILPWEAYPESRTVREWFNRCATQPFATAEIDRYHLTLYRLCESEAALDS
jgi:hypothetical protein